MVEQIRLILKQAFEWFMNPFFLLSIALTCFVVILLPTKIQELLGYLKLINPIKGYFGLVGILFFVFGGTSFFVHHVIPFFNWLLFLIKRKTVLVSLSSQEKECLSRFIKSDQICLSFDPSDGVINMLIHKNIVLRPSNIGSLRNFDFCLQPWVVEMFKKNPETKSEIMKHFRQIL